MNNVRDKISSGLGCIFEWYDFALYNFYAPIFAKLYFTNDSKTIGFMKTLAIFAIGFFARPIGALIFGYISDKYGRVSCLKNTPLLITIPTLCAALLPTYQQIGILAPSLLILIRIIQGLCIGGEFSNNIIYFCESSSIQKRYFFGSIGAFTGSIGILLASYVSYITYICLSNDALLRYGWRIAFGTSIILGIAIYFLRRCLDETSVYKRISSQSLVSKNPLIESYKTQWRDYLKAIGLIYFPATAFYFIFMFVPNYLQSISIFSAGKILGNNSISLLSRLLIIPIVGIIADQWCGIKMVRLSCFLFLIFSIPLYYLLLHDPSKGLFCLIAFGLLSTLNSATTPGLLIMILKPATRSTIFSFTFNLCFGVFGGIIPTLGFLLIKFTGSQEAPIYYLLSAAIITLITTFYINHGICYE